MQRSQPSVVAEILDYLLISMALQPLIEQVDIDPAYQSDLSIPWLVLGKNNAQRGPGFWKLNISLLQDESYVNQIKQVIQAEKNQSHESPALTWEMIKLQVSLLSSNPQGKQEIVRGKWSSS